MDHSYIAIKATMTKLNISVRIDSFFYDNNTVSILEPRLCMLIVEQRQLIDKVKAILGNSFNIHDFHKHAKLNLKNIKSMAV